jgi:hypothetical protein
MKIPWDKVSGRAYFGVGIVALFAIPLVLAYMGLGLIGLLFALPILGWIASRLLVHGGSHAFSWMSRQALEEWQGTYYAFNDVQVRVFEDDDPRRLLFVVDDVVMAMGWKRLPESFRIAHPRDLVPIPGTRLFALDPAGVERLLAKRNDHEAMRFLNWMKREVVAPWEKGRR